jgi:hypothetical protein
MRPAVAALVVASAILGGACRQRHATVSHELDQWLRSNRPQVSLVGVDQDDLLLKDNRGFNLRLSASRLEEAVSTKRTLAERAEVYRGLIDDNLKITEPLTPTDAKRIRPLLLRNEDLAMFGSVRVPQRWVDGLPLSIAYVLDGARTMRFVLESDLPALGLTPSGLYEHAVANLETPDLPKAIRHTLEQHGLANVNVGDDYDATRLILLPALLRDGEQLLALVAERNSLLLAPIGSDVEGLSSRARSW